MKVTRKMVIKADREKVLRILRENLAEHEKIVAEAREGYFKKKVAFLRFDLAPPVDHSSSYRTAIRMLELHEDSTISLSPDDVRNLVQNDWSWARGFYAVNAQYSATAERKLSSAQLGDDE